MSHFAYANARIIDELEVDALPAGEISRLVVNMVHDGLGSAIRMPLLCARGTEPGPVFGISAVVHGDELNGIPIIHRLFDKLDCERLKGTVVGIVVVNVPGYLIQERLFDERVDLNHVMPGRPDGNETQVYGHRLIQRVVRHFDYLVDLHTASHGRVNSIYVRADMTHPVTAQMAYRQRPDIIVHNPSSDRTLRGAAMALSIPAITVEIGNPLRFQRDYIRRSLVGLRAVLADAGMMRKRKVKPGAPPVLCEQSYWLYTDHGGLLEVYPKLVQRLEAGEPIAELTNIFGDQVAEYRAPEAGVVIGHSVNPVAHTGARILHLGIEAADDHQFERREEE